MTFHPFLRHVLHKVWIFIGKEKEHILVVLTLTEFLQKS